MVESRLDMISHVPPKPYPMDCDLKWSVYEIIHIWTAVIDESEEW